MPGFEVCAAPLFAKVPLSESRQTALFEGGFLPLLAWLKRNGGSVIGTHVLSQPSAEARTDVV
jgi:hypothetical protein